MFFVALYILNKYTWNIILYLSFMLDLHTFSLVKYESNKVQNTLNLNLDNWNNNNNKQENAWCHKINFNWFLFQAYEVSWQTTYNQNKNKPKVVIVNKIKGYPTGHVKNTFLP